MSSTPTTARMIRPAVLVKVTSSKNVPAPSAISTPVAIRKVAAPIDSAPAMVAARRAARRRPPPSSSSAIGRESMVSSSGNEQGEKNDATPPASASISSVAPVSDGRSKRGNRT